MQDVEAAVREDDRLAALSSDAQLGTQLVEIAKLAAAAVDALVQLVEHFVARNRHVAEFADFEPAGDVGEQNRLVRCRTCCRRHG